MSMVTEVKLELKKQLLNYNRKPIKNTDTLREIQQQNSTLTQEQILEKCPDMTFGMVLPQLLLQVPSQESTEKLKLFRWASKIEDKMVTDKGELSLDLNQIIELYDFIARVQTAGIVVISSILICLEELKEKLKNTS